MHRSPSSAATAWRTCTSQLSQIFSIFLRLPQSSSNLLQLPPTSSNVLTHSRIFFEPSPNLQPPSIFFNLLRTDPRGPGEPLGDPGIPGKRTKRCENMFLLSLALVSSSAGGARGTSRVGSTSSTSCVNSSPNSGALGFLSICYGGGQERRRPEM